jgi:hypothetical protein
MEKNTLRISMVRVFPHDHANHEKMLIDKTFELLFMSEGDSSRHTIKIESLVKNPYGDAFTGVVLLEKGTNNVLLEAPKSADLEIEIKEGKTYLFVNGGNMGPVDELNLSLIYRVAFV